MELNEYQKLAMVTSSKPNSQLEDLLVGVMGLCGESGEVIDHVKKHIAQGHELDRNKLIEELGDVAWYLAKCAAALNTDLETICQMNITKLKKRYPNGFSSYDSINRKD